MPYLVEGNRTQGVEWQFELQDCLDWYEAYQDQLEAKRSHTEQQDDDEAEEDSALKQAKLEKIRVETQRLELRLAREQGELVPIDSVASIVERQYTAVRAQLLALPHKLAPLLAGKTDIQEIDEILKSYLYEALNELQLEAVTNIEEPSDADTEREGLHSSDTPAGRLDADDGHGQTDDGSEDLFPQ